MCTYNIVQKVDCSAATTANPFGIWLVFFSEHNKYVLIVQLYTSIKQTENITSDI